MDNNSSSTEPGSKYLSSPSSRINMCRAKLAVRVSNVEEQEPRPHIEQLLSSDLIYSNCDVPLITFACTHWEGASPTISPFPKNGTIGKNYHRLGLSLDEILKDTTLYVPKNSKVELTVAEVVQYIHIKVTRTDEEKKYWSQRNDHEVLDTSEVNPFIFYNKEAESWFCNNYSDCTDRYFVYLDFGPGLKPTYEYWDTVKKTKEWTERGPDQRYGNDPAFQEFQYR
ncbi:unnamed protein product [Auanema sp. JU1783]|nr:unnamed protein product [Auanema sp. JU1783]